MRSEARPPGPGRVCLWEREADDVEVSKAVDTTPIVEYTESRTYGRKDRHTVNQIVEKVR